MRQPQRPQRIPPRRPAVSPNLLGEPCEHVWGTFRGYAMCTQPMCGALSQTNGTIMSRTQVNVLIAQLRAEQGPW